MKLGRFLGRKEIKQTVLAQISPKWHGVPDAEILDLIRAGAGDGGILGDLSIARDDEVYSIDHSGKLADHRD